MFDVSNEQVRKGTTFMIKFHRQGINNHIIEPDLHNQKPVEGVIMEVRHK